jgi:hypothetical protein
MSNAMQEAILQLIEEQLAQEELGVPFGGDENAELHASGYYALFVDTVPDDVKRLYTESAQAISLRWRRQHTASKGCLPCLIWFPASSYVKRWSI